MSQILQDDPRQLPGLVATLTAGFELTTGHLWLIVMPVMVDVFYWLGPRLSFLALVERNAAILSEEPGATEIVTQMLQLASQVNLFTLVSLPLVGIPALMGGAIPDRTPVGTAILEVDNSFLFLGSFTILALVGIILTCIYLGLISIVIREQHAVPYPGPGVFGRSVLLSSMRLLGLCIVFLLVLLGISFPLLPVAVILGLIGGGLFIVVILVGFLIVATYMSLAVPGIVFSERPVLLAVGESLRLVHRNLLPTVSLLLVIFVIGNGMNQLWHLADNGTWLTLVSIAGHAFVSTALAAAFFVYYRDRFSAQHAGSWT